MRKSMRKQGRTKERGSNGKDNGKNSGTNNGDKTQGKKTYRSPLAVHRVCRFNRVFSSLYVEARKRAAAQTANIQGVLTLEWGFEYTKGLNIQRVIITGLLRKGI